MGAQSWERERHGKYRLVSSLCGYLRYLRVTLKPPSARQRYIAAKADLLEIKVGKMKASLVPVEVVQAEWEEFCRAVRSRILGVPSSAAPFLVGQTDMAVIEGVLGDIVQKLVRELEVPERSRWTTPSSWARSKQSSSRTSRPF